MNRTQKEKTVTALKPLFDNAQFYIVDPTGLTAKQIFIFRKMLYEQQIICKMIPNVLLHFLLAHPHYAPLLPLLKKSSMLLFACKHAGLPGKVIKEFHKKNKVDVPVFKAAWCAEETWIGAQQLEVLANFKSREELIAEVVSLLQNPMHRVISALESGQHKLSGIVKRLQDQYPRTI